MHYIYAIQHNVTKKIYVGCSKNVGKRYLEHLNNLRHGHHSSKEMQEDFNNYGEDYSVFILEKVANGLVKVPADEFHGESLTKRTLAEVKWMREYNTVTNGYNAQDTKAKRILGIDQKKDCVPFRTGLPEKF